MSAGLRPPALAVACSVVLSALALACGSKPVPPAEPVDVPPPAPVVDGTVVVPVLEAHVSVERDRWGIPHISATTPHDLFVAQGYVQAQDRLFQMDLWRRAAQGRLAEVLGANFIERDAMTRRMQYRGDLEQEWASYGPDARAIAAAFVAGINARVAQVASAPPPEFVLAGWAPEQWRPEDLLNRTDSFVTSAGARDEVLRARLVARIGAAVVDQIWPLPNGEKTRVPAGVDLAAITPVVAETIQRAGTAPFLSGLAAPLTSGSNAWVIASPERPPVVAVDPHRRFESPSPRYLVHLMAPGWNVIGATAPWRPGVAMGHNQEVAWGQAAASVDLQDIFVERTNPRDPHEVMRQGRWVRMSVEHDSIQVKGRSEPFEYDRLYTSNGVVIGIDRERNLAYTLRWSGTEPGTAAELGALTLNRAGSIADVEEALQRWKMPAADFVFADRSGAIGRRRAAWSPRRGAGQGALPSAGWSGGGWSAMVAPPAERGATPVLAAANGHQPRVERIRQVLAEPSEDPVAVSRQLQHDVHAWTADRLVPALEPLISEVPDVESARRALLGWNREVTAESREAQLFTAFERELARALAASKVPAEFVDEVAERLDVVAAMDPGATIWFETEAQRRAALLSALTLAVEQVKRSTDAEGRMVPGWSTFVHPLGVSEAARRRFNVGPFALAGYSATVFAVSANRMVGPSLQAIFDVGDWDRSLAVNAPGQSEAPGSPHFKDYAQTWGRGGYSPLPYSDAAIRASDGSRLMLQPR